jgi:ATP-binding cassette, subfamily B, bacterial MsbA
MVSSFGATYRPLWALLQRTGASRLRLASALGLMLVAGALESASFGLLVPLLATVTGGATAGDALSRLFPAGVGPNGPYRVLFLSAGILLMFVLKNVFGYFSVREAARVRRDSLTELRRRMLDGLLHAPASALEKLTSGEISGAFLIEAGRANRALEYALALGQRAIIASGYAVAIVLISLRLTLATAVLGVVLGAITAFIARRLLSQGRDLVSSNAALGREVSETVGGLRVLRAQAGEEQRQKSFERVNAEHAGADVAMSITNHRATATTEMLGIAGAMGLTAGAHALWIAPGTLSVSHFLAFGFGLLRLLPALNQVYGMHAGVASFTGSVEKVIGWLELPRHPVRPFGRRELGPLTDGLTFDALCYEYVEGRRALDQVTFELKAGETVAILGSSGSGKTTLASLLMRLREPTSGTIRFDRVDYWEFAPKSFHRAVAFVEQDPFMFNASIAENVAYGAPWVGRAEVERAVRQVHLADVVAALPQGLDTVLGERGATLSGGQRQRLAIARAIVREPVLLILDEPTSALDADTEKEVMAAIESASAGRTTLIITHRTSTIERAQRVVRLSGGKLERVDVVEPPPLRAGASR